MLAIQYSHARIVGKEHAELALLEPQRYEHALGEITHATHAKLRRAANAANDFNSHDWRPRSLPRK